MSQPRIHSNKASSFYPKLLCTGCYQNVQASSYHSFPQITPLHKNPISYPLQSPVTNSLPYTPITVTFVNLSPFSKPALPDHPLVSPFIDPRSLSSRVLQPSHIHHCTTSLE